MNEKKQYYYYDKEKKRKSKKRILRFLGFGLSLSGLAIVAYVSTPFIMWQLFLAPLYAASAVTMPIPKTQMLTPSAIRNFLASGVSTLSGIDDSIDAKNWYPTYIATNSATKIARYTLSIPKLSLSNAVVTTVDTDLASHLVHLQGTAVAPDKGNDVIFGHSTLPYLFDPHDYKTIFAKVYELSVGDTIYVNIGNVKYTYKIVTITVVDPNDTSVLSQPLDDSYLTLITCTPPGTTLYRLIVKSRLQTI